MGHYKALRGGLDILVANDQLELLLSRRSASRSSTGTLLSIFSSVIWEASCFCALRGSGYTSHVFHAPISVQGIMLGAAVEKHVALELNGNVR